MTKIEYKNGAGFMTKLFCWVIFFVYAYYAGKYWFSLLDVGVGALTVLNVMFLIVIPVLGFFIFMLAVVSLISQYNR